MKLALFACAATLLCCLLLVTIGQAQQPVSDVDQLITATTTETADSVAFETPKPANKTVRYIRMKRNLTWALSVVKAMDLYKVEARLVKELNWTRAYSTEVVNEYKRFLVLGFMKTSGWSLVPSIHVDEAWHAHILHTRMYMKHCNKLFGHYFHHNPADPVPPQQQDGNNNTTPAAPNKQQDEFKQGFAATLAAYRQLFGEPNRVWLPSSCGGCNGECSGEKKAGCGHGCGGDKKAGCGHGCGGDKKAAAGCGHGCGGDATAGCGHGCGGDKKAGCGHGCGGDKDAAGCGHGCGGDKEAAGCGHGCGGDKDAAGCGHGCGGDKDAAAACGSGCNGGCKGDKHDGSESVEGSCGGGGCSGGCKGDKHDGSEGVEASCGGGSCSG